MRLRNILIVVNDIEKSKQFYHDLFGLDVLLDQGGNVIMSEGLVLQDASLWKGFLNREVISMNNSSELYFEEPNIELFVEKLKELYENFDFRNELKNNPLFGQLLYSGIPLKTAYEVLHKDEILSGAMAYTAQKVREQVVKGIEAKGRRPIENGMASESGIVTVTDVNALTSKDILKILKQVEKGASVKF
jgi:hypothetical protein